MDDEVDELTIWYCHFCKYSANENERQETHCPHCSQKSLMLFKDDFEEYRYCSSCLFISSERLSGPEPMGEAIFRTDLTDSVWWHVLLRHICAGAIIGLFFWLVFDRGLTYWRIISWVAGGATLCGLFGLPRFQKSLLKEIRVRAEGFTVVRKGGATDYTWANLRAVRFQEYPIINLGSRVRTLQFRTGGKNIEVTLDGLNAPALRAFHSMVTAYIKMHGIAPHCPAMPTFQNILSRVAAWTFVAGGFGMLIAHFFAYHTLGTIFGASVMATGTIMAVMTRKEKLSRRILAATVILIAGVIILVKAFDINVQQVLNDWETRERELGRPPWKTSDPNAPAAGTIPDNTMKEPTNEKALSQSPPNSEISS
jgi:hypothetical protein